MITEDKCTALLKEIHRCRERVLRAARDDARQDDYVTGTKATGAARRASMDLTRALAEFRKV